MKILGYERIDSVKDGKETHATIIHRQVPCTRSGSAGFKSSDDFISDQVLKACGLDFGDIVSAYNDGKDVLIETVRNGNYTEIASILIL